MDEEKTLRGLIFLWCVYCRFFFASSTINANSGVSHRFMNEMPATLYGVPAYVYSVTHTTCGKETNGHK